MVTQYDVISDAYHNSWRARARTCSVNFYCQILPARQEHVYMYDKFTIPPRIDFVAHINSRF